jgi:hypothetical protein
MKRFPVIAKKYSGLPRLTGPWPKFKKGDVVFVCDMTDLFAMPPEMVSQVLNHCGKYPDAEYVLQTKQPWNVEEYTAILPPNVFIGTTIETDYGYGMWYKRAVAIKTLREKGYKTFVTIEPVMKFSLFFCAGLVGVRPSFINIGADSKGSGLEEPTAAEVRQLIAQLEATGIEVRQKPNLKRILEANQ